MKRQTILIILAVCVAFCCVPGRAHAALYEFIPVPSDLYDLDHYKYYTWGMELNLAPGETILSANLFIDDINNWRVEEDNLYIHLLDEATLGVTTFTDNQGGGDNFATWPTPHILLDIFTDLQDAPGPSEDYSYDLTAAELAVLNGYILNGNFGLGLDPDCHYWNNGAKFSVQTGVVPEPTTMMLMASGLLGAFGIRKRSTSV